jgi:oligopeptide/dipeptide ABC transporter ATP-binding protein
MTGPADVQRAEFSAGGAEKSARSPAAAAGSAGQQDEPLLVVGDLRVQYRSRRGPRSARQIRAVDGVSFSVAGGEILALVGESGCGKTSIVRAIARLTEPAGGRVLFRGEDVSHVRRGALRRLRRVVQVVFQDPFESLDPRLNAYDTVAESLIVHRLGGDQSARRELVHAALEQVGLHPAGQIAGRYPHQLSGGQRQRLVIAGAMVLGPDLLIADEPVSMLDVSLRAGVLRVMLDLREQRGVSILFVTHDLSLAWVVADRVAVVYLGRIVEMGTADQVIQSPMHPYTQALVSVIPVPEAGAPRERILLSGEAPSASRVPPGCRFHPRCPLYRQLGEPANCRSEDPALLTPTAGEARTGPADPAATSTHAQRQPFGRAVACHYAKESS